MQVLGKIVVFPSTNQNGNFKTFRGSISKNTGTSEEPVFENYSIDVKFTKAYTTEQLNKFKDDECYNIEIINGYLSFDHWTKDNVNYYKPVIYIAEAKILEHKKYNQSNNTAASTKTHSNSKNAPKTKPANASASDVKDDDLPF